MLSNQHIKSYDTFLNEGFFDDLWKKVRFGGTVKKMAKKIADLRFELRKRELDIKNAKIKKHEDPRNFTEGEIAELKTYEDEATNLEQQLEHNYGDQEVLMKLAKKVELEEENINIKKLRGIAMNKTDKDTYAKLSTINTEQQKVIDQQLTIAKKFGGDFSGADYAAKKEIQKRNDLLKKLEKERMSLQNENLRKQAELTHTKSKQLSSTFTTKSPSFDDPYEAS